MKEVAKKEAKKKLKGASTRKVVAVLAVLYCKGTRDYSGDV